jgi:hypothetical protein
MSERSKRRAAEHRVRKQAAKHSNQPSQPAPPAVAQGQTIYRAGVNNAAFSSADQPLDSDSPINQPINPTTLDPVEESQVEISEMHAQRRALDMQEFETRLAARRKERGDSKPVSDAQLAANQANSQLSTGPTSDAGKAISSRNNFRHGLTQSDGELALLECESKDEYLDSLAAFQKEWKPATATENDLVNRLACHQWLRRRALKLQTYYLGQTDGKIGDYEQHALYCRYEARHDRAFNKALSDLIRLRGLRLREQNGFESQQRKNAEHEFRMSTLKNREKLQQLAIRTAESRATLQERKLQLLESRLKPQTSPNSPEASR